MTDFPIEKDHPVPAAPDRRWRNSKYPWADMEPGDSFFVPLERMPQSGLASFRAACHARGISHNRVYRAKEEGDGVRVWYVGPKYRPQEGGGTR